MIGKQNRVAARLKENIKHFLTSVHYVTHMTTLPGIDAIKIGPCKDLSREIDVPLNSVAVHFKKSSKRKNTLLRLQERLANFTKYLKIYHEIRWLSGWQTVTTFCDSLESVLTYFQDNHNAMEDGIGSNIFRKLHTFKYIYVFFWVDILHVLSRLSRLFQSNVLDITTISSVVKTDIVQIHMFFIKETADLNSETFNEQTGYHILLKFGHQGG